MYIYWMYVCIYMERGSSDNDTCINFFMGVCTHPLMSPPFSFLLFTITLTSCRHYHTPSYTHTISHTHTHTHTTHTHTHTHTHTEREIIHFSTFCPFSIHQIKILKNLFIHLISPEISSMFDPLPALSFSKLPLNSVLPSKTFSICCRKCGYCVYISRGRLL